MTGVARGLRPARKYVGIITIIGPAAEVTARPCRQGGRGAARAGGGGRGRGAREGPRGPRGGGSPVFRRGRGGRPTARRGPNPARAPPPPRPPPPGFGG